MTSGTAGVAAAGQVAAELAKAGAAPRRLDAAAIHRLGEEIAVVAAQEDAILHRFLTCVRAFDEAEGWGLEGALSCAHWLSWRVGLDLGAARERVRVARALGELPLIDAALRAGGVSYSKVRAMTRVATAENEARLLELARAATGSQLEKICRRYRGVLRADDPTPAAEPDRYVRHYPTDDGMVHIVARLHRDEAAIVLKAIEHARRERRPVAPPTAAEPRATRAADLPAGSSPPPAAGVSEPRATRAGDVSAGSSPPPAAGVAEPRATRAANVPAGSFSAPAAGVAEPRTTRAADVPAGTHPGSSAEEPERDEGVPDVPEETPRTPPYLRAWASAADALVTLAERYLDGGAAAADGRQPRYEVTVLVDRAALAGESSAPCTLDGELGASAETARRLACDAAVVEVTVGDDGELLGEGRRTRSIPTVLRRALALRDGGCRFPGCTNRLTDGHHVQHWAQGGETSLANVLLLCRRHHRLVHEGGFRVVNAEGGPVFLRPDGSRLVDAPPPARPGPRPPEPVRPVPVPLWDGEQVDYGMAVEALL